MIGDNAIASWGYTSTCLNANCTKSTPYKVGPDGRGGEQPRGSVITGNLAHEIGLYQKQSSMFFSAVSAGTHFAGNVFFNGPRAAINYNDGFGECALVLGRLQARACGIDGMLWGFFFVVVAGQAAATLSRRTSSRTLFERAVSWSCGCLQQALYEFLTRADPSLFVFVQVTMATYVTHID